MNKNYNYSVHSFLRKTIDNWHLREDRKLINKEIKNKISDVICFAFGNIETGNEDFFINCGENNLDINCKKLLKSRFRSMGLKLKFEQNGNQGPHSLLSKYLNGNYDSYFIKYKTLGSEPGELPQKLNIDEYDPKIIEFILGNIDGSKTDVKRCLSKIMNKIDNLLKQSNLLLGNGQEFSKLAKGFIDSKTCQLLTSLFNKSGFNINFFPKEPSDPQTPKIHFLEPFHQKRIFSEKLAIERFEMYISKRIHIFESLRQDRLLNMLLFFFPGGKRIGRSFKRMSNILLRNEKILMKDTILNGVLLINQDLQEENISHFMNKLCERRKPLEMVEVKISQEDSYSIHQELLESFPYFEAQLKNFIEGEPKKFRFDDNDFEKGFITPQIMELFLEFLYNRPLRDDYHLKDLILLYKLAHLLSNPLFVAHAEGLLTFSLLKDGVPDDLPLNLLTQLMELAFRLPLLEGRGKARELILILLYFIEKTDVGQEEFLKISPTLPAEVREKLLEIWKERGFYPPFMNDHEITSQKEKEG